MSVPVNQRSHGKLEAYSKAYELIVYTMKITNNKKIFNVQYQRELTDRIVNSALGIYLLVGRANDITVKTKNDKENYKKRLALQSEALLKCSDLNRLIFLAKPIFHLTTKRVKYWVGLTQDTRNLIKAWSDSDKKRFEPLFVD